MALVAGGGAAAVAVAHNNTTTHLPAAAHSTATESTAAHDSHAHTVAVEGTLKAYDAGGKTITVQPKDDDSAAKTIAVNGETEVNGAHANTLADLTHHIGDDVQVQATKQKVGSLLAWKITMQGGTPESGDEDAQEVQGTVVSVDVAGSSFVVKLREGGTMTMTVTVNTATAFDSRARKLADLVKGTTVLVHGTR